jgi:hypothetical protein
MDWSDSDDETEVSFTMTDIRDGESQTSASGPSHRAPSPAPSIYSLTASLRENLLVNVHGRTLNSSSEVYQLPADEEEIYRLGGRKLHHSPRWVSERVVKDLQHRMWKTARRGKNYCGPVAEVLTPTHENGEPAILDLGWERFRHLGCVPV